MQIQFYQYIVQLNISVYLQFPRSTAIQLKEIALMFDYVKRANFSTEHASFVSKILRVSALFMRRYSSVLLWEFKTSQLYILKTKRGGEMKKTDARTARGLGREAPPPLHENEKIVNQSIVKNEKIVTFLAMLPLSGT